MSGFLQRLLDREASTSSTALNVSSLARTQSPLADHDQRLHAAEFRDLGIHAAEPFDGDFNTFERPAQDLLPKTPGKQPTETLKQNEISATHSSTDAQPDIKKTEGTLHPASVTVPIDPIAALRAKSDLQPSTAPNPTETKKQQQFATPHQETKVIQSFSQEVKKEATTEKSILDQPAVMADTPKQEMTIPSESLIQADAIKPSFWPEPSDFEPNSNSVKPVTHLGEETPVEQQAVLPVQPLPLVTPPHLQPESSLSESVDDNPTEQMHSPKQNERVIERIIEKTVEKPQAQAAIKSPPLTAESISKIGALPVRRRIHTIFGTRLS
ncbi:MAG: hypothetical protein AAGA53_16560 [Pseudomonadota bacterium]